MSYTINPSCFSSVFTVPCAAVDNCILLATEMQLKVLLCAMRNISDGIDTERLSKTLNAPVSQIDDAMLYWCQAGIFVSDKPNENTVKTEEKAAPPPKTVKPTYNDVINRGAEDPKVSFLMREAQNIFGRSLTMSESTNLLWLYDSQGMDISVIMMLLQFALNENKLNTRFIVKTAQYWTDNGVETVQDAEKQIADAARRKTAWHIVEKCFGIERRLPSTKEAELSDLWINEWKISEDMLKTAYDTCIDNKSKFLMSYVRALIENWHKAGYNTPEEVKNGSNTKKEKEKNSFAAYDIEAFEKMLDDKDD